MEGDDTEGWMMAKKGRRKQANAAKKIERSWGVFVLSGDDNVLLLKHKRTNSFWSFCKGHKKKEDVSDVETALRELREETGCKLGEQCIRLWMEGETWQVYENVVSTGDFRAAEGDDDSSAENFRTFVEQYKTAGHRKEVTFFVARTQALASVIDVDYSNSRGEIIGYMWVPLKFARGQVKKLTVIPHSERGKDGMYDEDLDLLDAIKQEILRLRIGDHVPAS